MYKYFQSKQNFEIINVYFTTAIDKGCTIIIFYIAARLQRQYYS